MYTCQEVMIGDHTCTSGLELFVAEQLSAVQTSVAVEELAVLPAPANQTKEICLKIRVASICVSKVIRITLVLVLLLFEIA